MAVSKTQNERPAIIALIDFTNQLEEAIQGEAETRAQDVQGLQTQIGDGFAETSITTSLGATNQQVTLLGEEQTVLAEDVSGILSTLDSIKFGVTLEITVPANDSYSGSYVFSEPFDESAKCFVFLGIADDLFQDTLSVTLIHSSYSGFSYSVSNTDTDPATVNVGFLAIAVIPLG